MTTNHVVSDEQLGRLARRQNDLFRRVREGSLPVQGVLSGLQRIIEGERQSESAPHIVDCDARPFVPKGWTVKKHRKGGSVDLAKTTITLFLSRHQQEKGGIKGHDLRKELADKPVLNANVLDYLLEHPELIPDDWKGRAVFFWGTVYRSLVHDDRLFVRYLYCRDDKWNWCDLWLGNGWDPSCPAACGTSSQAKVSRHG